MPVGTLGPVKGVEPQDLEQLGVRLMLNNAYHLYVRPGHKVVAEMGGLHRFIGWPGAILTDSGGFQIFSLAKLQCVALPAEREIVRDAVRRTTLWAKRCQAARRRRDQALFGIVQGGLDRALRVTSARDLVGIGFDGYAIGGLSVGESKDDMYAMVDVTVPVLPASKPRYLMGVGMPENLVEGVARGIDLFDCVVPSRHGRTGWLFTSFGRVLIKHARYLCDERPIDPTCGCPVCARYSRAYLHHLYNVKEMLASRLNTIHNLWYFSDFMRRIRVAIAQGTFAVFRETFYGAQEQDVPEIATLANCDAGTLQRTAQDV
jgi:queuine tRNA-ribosyltransferase